MEELTRSQITNRRKKEIKRILLENYNMKFKGSFIDNAIYKFHFHWDFDKFKTVHETTDFLYDNVDKFVWYLFFADAQRKTNIYYYEKELQNKQELEILD